MQGRPDWRSAIALTCSFAVIVVVAVWNIRKGSSKKIKQSEANDAKEIEEVKETVCSQNSVSREVEEISSNDAIPDLPEPKWVKVGRVEELFFYPLKSGRGKDVTDCNFTEFGISVEKKGRFALRDRMFLVYNEETGRFQTGRNYPTMILVTLSAVDEFKAKLEAVGMPSVVFDVPKDSAKNAEAIECKMWWGEPIKCIDCGPQAAEWLSRFLTGTNSGLRLGHTVIERRNILTGPWERFTKVYKTLRDEDTGLFCDLTSYMLMTTESLGKLNEKLESPVPALQFRPNILVSGQEPFAEDNWEWIKVGETAVIRNVKPCTRCKLIRVNPETGEMAKEEPMKTLQSFREETDAERVSVDGNSPSMGIYCGLYVPGRVKIGDDVFVHVPDNALETNLQEDARNLAEEVP